MQELHDQEVALVGGAGETAAPSHFSAAGATSFYHLLDLSLLGITFTSSVGLAGSVDI